MRVKLNRKREGEREREERESKLRRTGNRIVNREGYFDIRLPIAPCHFARRAEKEVSLIRKSVAF